jgi:hypothetical protein
MRSLPKQFEKSIADHLLTARLLDVSAEPE